MHVLVCLFFSVIRTSAVDCLERLIAEVTIMCWVGCKALLTQLNSLHATVASGRL